MERSIDRAEKSITLKKLPSCFRRGCRIRRMPNEDGVVDSRLKIYCLLNSCIIPLPYLKSSSCFAKSFCYVPYPYRWLFFTASADACGRKESFATYIFRQPICRQLILQNCRHDFILQYFQNTKIFVLPCPIPSLHRLTRRPNAFCGKITLILPVSG